MDDLIGVQEEAFAVGGHFEEVDFVLVGEVGADEVAGAVVVPEGAGVIPAFGFEDGGEGIPGAGGVRPG